MQLRTKLFACERNTFPDGISKDAVRGPAECMVREGFYAKASYSLEGDLLRWGIVVIRTDALKKPAVMTTGAAGGGASFLGGSFQGIAFVVEVDTPKILCTQCFSATSSKSVDFTAFKDGVTGDQQLGASHDDAQRSADADFKTNFKRALAT